MRDENGTRERNNQVKWNDQPKNNQHEETDDWMLLCRLNQHYEQSGDLLLENGTDWFEEARSVPLELLRECPGWISKQRKDAEERGRQPLTAQPQNGHPAIDFSVSVANREVLREHKIRYFFSPLYTQNIDLN